MSTPSADDELLTRVLNNAAAITEHLTLGLDAMLTHSGFTPDMRAALAEFIAPALGLLRDTERDVIRHLQNQPITLTLAEEGKDRPRGR